MNVNELITAADTDDWKKRSEITEMLVRIGKPAISAFVSVLQHSTWYVRNCVAIALQRMGWKPSSDIEKILFLIARWDLKGSADKVVQFGSKAVEFLIPLLKDKSEWAAGKAADALGKIGDPRATQPLVKALSRSGLIFNVPTALANIGDPRAIEPLTNALQNKDLAPAYRKEIIEALTRLGVETEETEEDLLSDLANLASARRQVERYCRIHNTTVKIYRMPDPMARRIILLACEHTFRQGVFQCHELQCVYGIGAQMGVEAAFYRGVHVPLNSDRTIRLDYMKKYGFVDYTSKDATTQC